MILTQPHELRALIRSASVHVSIHDRKTIANPFYDGMRLDGGNKYEATITEVLERTSSPSPYDTHCKDYLSEWRQKNGSGPLTYQDCFQSCIIQSLKKEDLCIPYFISYPHRERICDKYNIFISEKLQTNCKEECRNPCL
nr:uncharacterized protein LOC122269866 [Parasteatoda tepidariorum]